MTVETWDYFVYFIGAYQGGVLQAVKIGWSKNLEARLVSLQIANHCELRLLASVLGDVQLEKQFHREWATEQLQGEWFRPTAGLLSLVSQIQAGTWQSPFRPPERSPVILEELVEVEIEPPYWKSCSVGQEGCKGLPGKV